MLLTMLLLATVSGCCGMPVIQRPQLPPGKPVPTLQEVLKRSRNWLRADGLLTLPIADHEFILADRARWVAYALALEIVLGAP